MRAFYRKPLGALLVALLTTSLAPGTAPAGAADERRNGFALSGATVPPAEVLRGAPRDAIPALSRPRALPAPEAPWSADEIVVGFALGGEARAYPLALLTWHELVNDVVGDRPILVSYCPLCGTAIVFDRRLDGETLEFGVSGLLYRSDLLMYDRATESLWSQIKAEAVTGARRGSALPILRSRVLRWGEWRALHPDTTVLGTDTGHNRPYDRSPYGDYAHSRETLFPAPIDERFHPKELTLGLRLEGGAARAYPASELARAGGCVEEEFAGAKVRIEWRKAERTFRYSVPDSLSVIEGYWFAWAAFHPETGIFRAEGAADAACPAPQS